MGKKTFNKLTLDLYLNMPKTNKIHIYHIYEVSGNLLAMLSFKYVNNVFVINNINYIGNIKRFNKALKSKKFKIYNKQETKEHLLIDIKMTEGYTKY